MNQGEPKPLRSFQYNCLPLVQSFDQQQRLYNQGRTEPGQIVTNARPGKSYHNYALAFDVVDRDKGYNADWQAIGRIGKSIGLTWGGDWKNFKDRPHFQIKGYTISELKQKLDNNNINNKGFIKL